MLSDHVKTEVQKKTLQFFGIYFLNLGRWREISRSKGLGGAWGSLLCFAGRELSLRFSLCTTPREMSFTFSSLISRHHFGSVCACVRVYLWVSTRVSECDPLNRVLILSYHKPGNWGAEANPAQTPTTALGRAQHGSPLKCFRKTYQRGDWHHPQLPPGQGTSHGAVLT